MEKNNHIIGISMIAIVAIVAVVGMIGMHNTGSVKLSDNSDSLAGQGFRSIEYQDSVEIARALNFGATIDVEKPIIVTNGDYKQWSLVTFDKDIWTSTQFTPNSPCLDYSFRYVDKSTNLAVSPYFTPTNGVCSWYDERTVEFATYFNTIPNLGSTEYNVEVKINGIYDAAGNINPITGTDGSSYDVSKASSCSFVLKSESLNEGVPIFGATITPSEEVYNTNDNYKAEFTITYDEDIVLAQYMGQGVALNINWHFFDAATGQPANPIPMKLNFIQYTAPNEVFISAYIGGLVPPDPNAGTYVLPKDLTVYPDLTNYIGTGLTSTSNSNYDESLSTITRATITSNRDSKLTETETKTSVI